MDSARAVLPIPGRPAIMIKSPSWKPDVISSRSNNPDGTPITDPPEALINSNFSKAATTISLICVKPPFNRFWVILKIDCSTVSRISATSWLSSYASLAIEWDKVIRLLSKAFSMTILEYRSTWAAVGTDSTNPVTK